VTPATRPRPKKPAAKKSPREKSGQSGGQGRRESRRQSRRGPKRPRPKNRPPQKAGKKPAAKKEPVAGEAKKERSKAAAKAPRRRVVRAHARYVRTSARKARMVAGTCAASRAGGARYPRNSLLVRWRATGASCSSRQWRTRESNHELLEEDLVVREAYADEGPTIKRFRPRAMGPRDADSQAHEPPDDRTDHRDPRNAQPRERLERQAWDRRFIQRQCAWATSTTGSRTGSPERPFLAEYLAEDVRIREHITNKLAHAGLSSITIRKDSNDARGHIHTRVRGS